MQLDLTELKQSIGDNNLLQQLEMAAKHLPTYNKIIKNHISQLESVLALDAHNNKTLNDINLSPVVKQLMAIFSQLEADDLEKLEELYQAAASWQTEQLNSSTESDVVSEATTV
jgi:hypothetical protein